MPLSPFTVVFFIFLFENKYLPNNPSRDKDHYQPDQVSGHRPQQCLRSRWFAGAGAVGTSGVCHHTPMGAARGGADTRGHISRHVGYHHTTPHIHTSVHT